MCISGIGSILISESLPQRTRHASGMILLKPMCSSAMANNVFCSKQYPPRLEFTSLLTTFDLDIEIVRPKEQHLYSQRQLTQIVLP